MEAVCLRHGRVVIKSESTRRCQRCRKLTKNLNLCDDCLTPGFKRTIMGTWVPTDAQKEDPELLDKRRFIIQKLEGFIRDLEQSIDILFEERHSHPMWPMHNNQLNALEEAQYMPVRRMYGERIRTQIRLLRRLRAL